MNSKGDLNGLICFDFLYVVTISMAGTSLLLNDFHLPEIGLKTKTIMSRVVRKLAICICKNKDADQLHGNREADQRL